MSADVTLPRHTAARVRECLLIGLVLLGDHLSRVDEFERLKESGKKPSEGLRPNYESCRGDAVEDVRFFAETLLSIEHDDSGEIV